ncbi:GGDEF domain-containing protein [Bacillus marasmi]|uniref:GGDEF domain-containing protein n=1 Tax=Bacillus marasmi TaxID=1926279 RepID=UPI0011C7D4D6|nr:GGDEF domain-containing protein [Bacillus marasmi]
MKYGGRFSVSFISLLVGIPYCVYNYLTLHSTIRTTIDVSVLIAVTTIVYWLGMQYDKANYFHKQLVIKQHQLSKSYRELMEFQQKLQQMAYYDELTSLPNRIHLYTFLKKSITELQLNKQTLVVLFIDLDGFKEVNDTTGHKIGDMLLKEAGNRIQCCIRDDDLVSRLGGDEFIVVLNHCDLKDASEVASRIINEVSKPYTFNDEFIHVTASIGASIAPQDGEEEEILIQRADKAMYYAKKQGKNTFAFYHEDLENVYSKNYMVIEKS